MKVVIFEAQMRSLFSVLCSIVTGSGYSHGAIFHQGVLYDTTMTRGYFDIDGTVEDDRLVVCFDINVNPEKWINSNRKVEYDLFGLIFWIFGVQSSNKIYCFSAIDECLKSVGVDLKLGWRKDGGTIIDRLIALGYEAEVLTGKKFNEKYL